MKTASLKSKGGFIFNATTKRYEWDNNLVNNTELISLYSDDIWYIFSNKVIRDSNNDSPSGAPGGQPYSSIADLFSTGDADYLLFFDRDNIFANSANFTQLYNPDYYTFTIYKQPNFSAPPNVHDAYDLVSQYCQVQSVNLNRLKFSPAYIDDEKIVFKANTQLVRTVDDTPEETPPVVTTPSTPAMAIVNMISDTPFISTFKNGFELESYYDAQAEGYRIENENNKVYLRDPAYAPVVSFRPKQGNLMGATQIQGEVYDWQGIGFDISLATPKHLNKIQNIYGFPSNDVVLVMLSQLNEGQSAPPVLNGRFVCNPENE